MKCRAVHLQICIFDQKSSYLYYTLGFHKTILLNKNSKALNLKASKSKNK